jgi:thioredoxin-like negative regulator of GroEL
MMTPILNELARDYGGLIKIAKLNVDQNPIISGRFHVLSVPTLLLFKNGQLINAIAGALNKDQLLYHLRTVL